MSQPESPDNLDTPASLGGNSPYALFRNRNFTLFLTGRLIAIFGQQMLMAGVDWEIYKRTNSALSLSFIGITQMVAIILCTLPAGYIADNFNRKNVVQWMNLVIGLMALCLVFFSAFNVSVNFFYICLVIIGCARTILWPSNASLLPHLVTREEFSRAVTFNSGTFQLAQMIGFSSGGVIIWLANREWVVYAVAVLTSVLYLIFLGCIRYQHKITARQPFSFVILTAGIKYIFENQIILGLITLDLFAVLLGGATSLFPIYARDILKSGPSGYGILNAAMPIGAVLCALWLTHRPPMQKAGRSMLLAVAAFGVATIVFGIANQNCFGTAIPNAVWFWVAFLMMVICGGVDNVSVIVRQSLVQLLAPDEKRGRISAINSLFIGTSNELGAFESTFLAWLFVKRMHYTNGTSAIISAVAGGIGTILVVAAVAWIWPQIRKYGKLG